MLAFPTVLLAGAAAVTAVAVPSARSPLVAMSKRTNPPSASFSWQNTSTLFAFGDSYTTTGYNVSAGIDSPDPGPSARVPRSISSSSCSSHAPLLSLLRLHVVERQELDPVSVPDLQRLAGPQALQSCLRVRRRPSFLLASSADGVFVLSGATIDAKFVTPYKPEVQSLKDQVDLWEKYFSSKPAAAPWTAEASLFTVWIGINE